MSRRGAERGDRPSGQGDDGAGARRRPKLAARLVLELKDKAPAYGVADLGGTIAETEPGSKLPKEAQDAVLALVSLGYARPQASLAVAKGVAALGVEAQTAALIRLGLKELAQ